jgi:hypothetical protein
MNLHLQILRKIVSDKLLSEFKLNTVIPERTACWRQYITWPSAISNLVGPLFFELFDGSFCFILLLESSSCEIRASRSFLSFS